MNEGLDNVIAASTRLSHVDGEAGRLTIAGYAVDDLAPAATFEDVAYLLLKGRLSSPRERAAFARDLAARREIRGRAGELAWGRGAPSVAKRAALRSQRSQFGHALPTFRAAEVNASTASGSIGVMAA